MAETCIVCLGDLGESANPLDPALSPAVQLEHAVAADEKSPLPITDQDDERIAHLLPCGHDLHNGCLKPWVERANSCPICRQSFNKVELSLHVGGKSYPSLQARRFLMANAVLSYRSHLLQLHRRRSYPSCRH